MAVAALVGLAAAGWGCLLSASAQAAPEADVASLPEGVRAVWDPARAQRDMTPTRERICLNGLWQWQPAESNAGTVPGAGWGWFKVPGSWPGTTDYLQKDSQRLIAHPQWRDRKLGAVSSAWHRREIVVPAEWAGRRIALQADYVNSLGLVFVDGKAAGEIRFPGGDLDLSGACRPGTTQQLALLVVALPLQGVLLSYTDSASAREIKGSVARRGLCGDVYLVSTPRGARLGDVRTSTSVRREEVTFAVSVTNLDTSGGPCQLRARLAQSGRVVQEIVSPAFGAAELTDGRMTFGGHWRPAQLWDTHTPTNQFDLQLALLDRAGRVLDETWTHRVGFREFWIDGRDFYLNGTRLHLSALPLDNAQVSAELATYEAARESLLRLQSFGINFVYTHNYDCLPGSHLSFDGILRAADDVGMLVSFSQPHFSHYNWIGAEAEATNGYRLHAAFYTRVAGDHPSVVCYSMSHNATGYNEDMNPDLMDGVHDARDDWARRKVARALRAEAIVHRLDPERMIYHHASGNLGPMHVVNFYANFAPAQELSDWFEHWASNGVKPLFTCEYGAPFTWDWTLYRGWHDGKREFGSASVPWDFCVAEWNAQFVGDRAYEISESERANLRWEAAQTRAGRRWHRWDYPADVSSSRFSERYPILAAYLTDNWRAFRTWGLSANSPWEHEHFWTLRPGVDRGRRDLPVDWEQLQRPGFSPDFVDHRYERMDLAYERSDWIPTPAAEALLRNNRPWLAYLAGPASGVTSKDHIFRPGERVQKQVVLINDAREPTEAEVHWAFRGPGPPTSAGQGRLRLEPGGQARLPIEVALNADTTPGTYELSLNVTFGSGEAQQDALAVHVVPATDEPLPVNPAAGSRVALYDPRGETQALLTELGVGFKPIDASTDLAGYDVLILGKEALTLDGPCPDVALVRTGLKLVVFEQSSAVLEQRLGFRVADYGLRNVVARVSDHPVLAGVTGDLLRDWRGEATLLPARATLEAGRAFNGAPTSMWCGMMVPRLWRCGNRGNVASVLIEKPARGDFRPILDGGFSLQYSPLLEAREGRGLMVFCQADVTGRTAREPAAEMLVRNLLAYVATWKPSNPRTAVYAGGDAGRRGLEQLGVTASIFEPGALKAGTVLILSRGAKAAVGEAVEEIAAWVRRGGPVFAIGLDQDEARAVLPGDIKMKRAEHIATYFEAPPLGSVWAGVGPADVHNRDPRELPLITSGATVLGNGILAQAGTVAYCQLAPWDFDVGSTNTPMPIKRTHRRVSYLLARGLANLGVAGPTPMLTHLQTPVAPGQPERRWRAGLYVDEPVAWDFPYRFFRW